MQDWRGRYRRHRANLQLIGLPDTGRRWVLKNTSHLFALDALLDAYPDALVVQTHREPRTAVASACSLSAQATEEWSDTFTGAQLGRDTLDLLGRGIDRFAQERARRDPGRFVDVHYDDFVADPVGTVRDVYTAFGLSFDEDARQAVTALHRQSATSARWPAHLDASPHLTSTLQRVPELAIDVLALAPGER